MYGNVGPKVLFTSMPLYQFRPHGKVSWFRKIKPGKGQSLEMKEQDIVTK